MTIPTVTIQPDGPASVHVQAVHVRDLPHIRRMTLLALCAVEGQEGPAEQYTVDPAKLALLRNFLTAQGCADTPKARRLLLMGLFQLEDEMEEKRVLVASPVLPHLMPLR